MSLKIWLPLNGNIENQGLADVTITNNGATVDNNGKIGKCYSFNGSSNYIQLTNSIIEGKKPFTFSVWYKTTSGNSYYPIISVGTSSKGFTIHGSVNRLEGGNGTNHFDSSNHITAVSWGMWAHLAVTYDGTKIQSYLNGVPNANSLSWTYGLGTGNTTIKIGHFWGGYFKGYINDFRIYDECLSADQIKEISRGMVLHYKMCGNTQVPNNCYSNPTFDTSNSDGGWGHWTASGGSGSFAQNIDKNFIFRSGQTYSHKVTCNSSSTYDYLCYQEPTFSGGYRSMCAIIKAYDGAKITENICYPTWNSRNGGVENNKWTSVNKLRDGFYLCKCEGIKQDGSNDLVGIYVKPGKTIYISECYLENNYERCSDFWTRTNIEYDGSGFKNHGTVSGNVTLSADSPRYTGSYKFGTNNYITTTSTGNYIKSATFWAKDAGSVPSDGLVFRDQNSGLAFGIQSGNLITGAVGGPAGSSSAPVSVSDAKYTANTWHFFACVNDNGTQRLYMDGIQISAGTGTGNWSPGSPTNSLNVGGRAGSSYWPGYISDFKMYVTVLSATDVQELYKLGRV